MNENLLLEKVLSHETLQKKVDALKQKGLKIVTYNGSFDILHAGHITSITEAKQQGDILILLLNSDASVKKYKSSKRPIIPQKERVLMVSALAAVDYIVLFDDINPKSLLEIIKPSIHCNGSDWGKDCLERGIVEKHGGIIHVLTWKPGFSTSNIVAKILDAYKSPLIKAVFIDRDGTINDNKSGYVHKKEDFIFLPGVISALKKLTMTNYKIIILTNQSGIGRNIYTEKQMHTLHNWMQEELEKNDIRINAIYHCPHTPEESCACRKPAIGMVMKAVDEFDVSLNDSWMIGDDVKDILMAREANIRSIKIGAKMSSTDKVGPNSYAKDLYNAVEIILNKEYGK